MRFRGSVLARQLKHIQAEDAHREKLSLAKLKLLLTVNEELYKVKYLSACLQLRSTDVYTVTYTCMHTYASSAAVTCHLALHTPVFSLYSSRRV